MVRHEAIGVAIDAVLTVALMAWRASFGVFTVNVHPVHSNSSSVHVSPLGFEGNGGENGPLATRMRTFLSGLDPSDLSLSDCLGTCVYDVFWLSFVRLSMLFAFYIVVPLVLDRIGGSKRHSSRSFRVREATMLPVGAIVFATTCACFLALKLVFFSPAVGGASSQHWQDWVTVCVALVLCFAGLLPRVLHRCFAGHACFRRRSLDGRLLINDDYGEAVVVDVSGQPGLRQSMGGSISTDNIHAEYAQSANDAGRAIVDENGQARGSISNMLSAFRGKGNKNNGMTASNRQVSATEQDALLSGGSDQSGSSLQRMMSQDQALARIRDSSLFRHNNSAGLDRHRSTGKLRSELASTGFTSRPQQQEQEQQERARILSFSQSAPPPSKAHERRRTGPVVLPSFPRLVALLTDDKEGIKTRDKRSDIGVAGISSAVASALHEDGSQMSRRTEQLSRCFTGRDLCDWLWAQLGSSSVRPGVTLGGAQSALLTSRLEAREIAQRLVDMGYIEPLISRRTSRDDPVADSNGIYYSVSVDILRSAKSLESESAQASYSQPQYIPAPSEESGLDSRKVTFNSRVEILRTPGGEGIPEILLGETPDSPLNDAGRMFTKIGSTPESPPLYGQKSFPVSAPKTSEILGAGGVEQLESFQASNTAAEPPRPSVPVRASPHLLNAVKDMLRRPPAGLPKSERIIYTSSTEYSKIPDCFTGAAAVTWIMESKQMQERAHALKVLNRMASTGILQRVETASNIDTLAIAANFGRETTMEDSDTAWYHFILDET